MQKAGIVKRLMPAGKIGIKIGKVRVTEYLNNYDNNKSWPILRFWNAKKCHCGSRGSLKWEGKQYNKRETWKETENLKMEISEVS